MSEAADSPRRRSVGFLLRFVALLVIFYLIVASGPVNDAVIVPFTAGIASVSAEADGVKRVDNLIDVEQRH